jgi:inorganic pyrophosphatase
LSYEEDGATSATALFEALVEARRHTHADIKEPSDSNGNMIKELEEFFASYHKPEGKKFKVLGCKDANAAMKLIKQSRKAA